MHTLAVVCVSQCASPLRSHPLRHSIAAASPPHLLVERIAHLWMQGCGDRWYSLLALRSALSGIPASSGFATHFESASDLRERLTKVSRFFLCCICARAFNSPWLGAAAHLSASSRSHLSRHCEAFRPWQSILSREEITTLVTLARNDVVTPIRNDVVTLARNDCRYCTLRLLPQR